MQHGHKGRRSPQRKCTLNRLAVGDNSYDPSMMRLVCGCINADFCDQGRIFPHFSSSTIFSFAPFQISVIFQAFAPFFLQNLPIFLWIFKGDSRFCKFSSSFNRFSRNFAEFQYFTKNCAKIVLFQRNLRNYF